MSRHIFVSSLLLSVALLGASRAAFSSAEIPNDPVASHMNEELPDPVLTDENLLSSPVSPGKFEAILNDQELRVGSDFKIPGYLRARVAFWLKVYTEYSSRHVVIYDRHHPELIYSVLDFRELRRKSRNEMAYEIVSKRRVEKELGRIKGLIHSIGHKQKRKKSLNADERAIFAIIQKSQHEHDISSFFKSVRSQTGLRDTVIHGLFRADGYFPEVEKIFTQQGVPTELMRVSLVESSFNPKAMSRVGAAGVWQFMEGMGAHFMRVQRANGLDERISPLKASEGAAKYFKINQRVLKNWFLTVISFNHGMTGIYKRMRKTGFTPERMLDACDKKFSLGFASGNFLAEFLAILYADRYRDSFYGKTQPNFVWSGQFFKLTRSVTLTQLSRQTGVSVAELRGLNLDILNGAIKLPVGYRVALPGEVFMPHSLLMAANNADNTRRGKKKL